MRLNKLLAAAAFCALVLILAGWTMNRPAPAQWEYKFITVKDGIRPDKKQDEVNALGTEGWELVSVERPITSGDSSQSISFFFKRPKQ